MSTTPPEEIGPADALNESLAAFTACIGESISDICSYGLTIGDSYVPFDPDEDECEDDDDAAVCSQVWVRVMSVTPVTTPSFDDSDCTSIMQIDLEVGVLRCIEITEGGEAPTASQVLAAAMQAMDDMKAIHCAAMSCEVWDSISSGAWSPQGPLGAQYGGTWTFTVSVS